MLAETPCNICGRIRAGTQVIYELSSGDIPFGTFESILDVT